MKNGIMLYDGRAIWHQATLTREDLWECFKSDIRECCHIFDKHDRSDIFVVEVSGVYHLLRHLRIISDYEHAQLCSELEIMCAEFINGEGLRYVWSFVPEVAKDA